MLKLGLLDINATSVNKAYLGSTIVFNGVFVSTWRTTTNNETITLPTPTNYTVNWGDGTTTTNTNSHEYATSGDYEIKISGEINDFAFAGGLSKDKILDVTNFGGLVLKRDSFDRCSNLNITTISIPSISDGLVSLFRGCSSLFYNNSIDKWDTSIVLTLQNTFQDCVLFNQPLNWNTSKVVSMSATFYGCSSFNQPLNWDTSKAVSMSFMFFLASSFNQLLNWDTSNVTNMAQMLRSATAFNQPLNHWSFVSVTDMSNFMPK